MYNIIFYLSFTHAFHIFTHQYKKNKKIIFHYNVSETTNSIKVLLDRYLDNGTSYSNYYKDYRHNPYILQINQAFLSSFLILGILHKYTIFLFLSIAQFTIHSSFT